MFGQYLDTVISVHFPGGRLGFAKAGCAAIAFQVPGDKDIAYILVPSAVSKELDLAPFREKVEKACEDKRVRLRWVSEGIMDGADPVEVKMKFMPLVVGLSLLGFNCHVTAHAAVFVVDGKMTKEEGEAVLEVVAASGIVRRAVVVLTVGAIEREFEMKAADEKPAEEPKAVIEAGARDHVITKDEVTNLTILIERANTVEDLLNNL
jgi:hypothetical protein